jgi:hypothetical protein
MKKMQTAGFNLFESFQDNQQTFSLAAVPIAAGSFLYYSYSWNQRRISRRTTAINMFLICHHGFLSLESASNFKRVMSETLSSDLLPS